MPKRRTENPEKMANAAPKVPKQQPLTDAARAELAAYAERRASRPLPPRFRPHQSAGAPDDPRAVSRGAGLDPDLFRARLAQTFGTVDELAVGYLLSQAAYLVEGTETDQLCDSASALIAGIAPRNEVEGLLAVQMLGAHNLGLLMARRALKTDRLDCLQQYGNLAAKFMNVFTRQLEALARLRGQTGQQTVRVEHVTVEAGGQAVVGAVNTGGTGACRAESSNDPMRRDAGAG